MTSILLFLSLMFENSKNLIIKSFIMKKLLLGVLCLTVVSVTIAQNTEVKKKVIDLGKIDLSNRPNDHFMIQYGADGWLNAPDSAKPSGFSRHFNFYFMYDKPFKTNPHYSIAIGAGLGTSNVFFKDTYINLKSVSATLPFTDVAASSVNRYKKFKLSTVFLEIPVELRFAQNPVTPDKGFKGALGLKVGTLLKSYTKGKNAISNTGATLYGDKYIVKESEKKFLNSTRFAVTGRIGFGNISFDGSYQITPLLKTGTGAKINPYSFGLTLSGL